MYIETTIDIESESCDIRYKTFAGEVVSIQLWTLNSYFDAGALFMLFLPYCEDHYSNIRGEV